MTVELTQRKYPLATNDLLDLFKEYSNIDTKIILEHLGRKYKLKEIRYCLSRLVEFDILASRSKVVHTREKTYKINISHKELEILKKSLNGSV